MQWATTLVYVLSAICLPSLYGWPADEVSLQGKLKSGSEKSFLQVGGKSVPLESEIESISATLHDPAISGKELKVEGSYRDDGSFQVEDFFVVKDNELRRLIYFCDT